MPETIELGLADIWQQEDEPWVSMCLSQLQSWSLAVHSQGLFASPACKPMRSYPKEEVVNYNTNETSDRRPLICSEIARNYPPGGDQQGADQPAGIRTRLLTDWSKRRSYPPGL